MPIACAIARPRAGRTSRAAAHGATAGPQNSRRARRGLVGGMHDDKHQARRRAITPPVTDSNNAGRSTTDSIRQGITRTRNRRRAVSAIAYSLLLACDSIDAALGRVGPRPAASCSHQKLAVCLSACDRAAVRIGHDSRVMQQNASLLWRHGPGPFALHMQQDAACHARRMRRAEREGACCCRRHPGLCADTHTPVRDGGASSREIRFACRLGTITS